MSARERARKAAAPKIDAVEWGGERHYVRGMSGKLRGVYSALVQEKKDKGGVPVEVIAAFGICEEDGTLAYDYAKPADIAELEDRDAGFLTAVALKLFELSGLTEKAVEEAEKN